MRMSSDRGECFRLFLTHLRISGVVFLLLSEASSRTRSPFLLRLEPATEHIQILTYRYASALRACSFHGAESVRPDRIAAGCCHGSIFLWRVADKGAEV